MSSERPRMGAKVIGPALREVERSLEAASQCICIWTNRLAIVVEFVESFTKMLLKIDIIQIDTKKTQQMKKKVLTS